MIKYVFTLLALVIGLVSVPVFAVSEGQTIKLDQNDCLAVANVQGAMVANKMENKDMLDGIINSEDFSKLDPQLQAHLKLLEAMVNKYPDIDPQTFAEAYFNFCVSADGNVGAMNDYISNEIKIQEL